MVARIIVSGCILGCECRYAGDGKVCQKVLDLCKDNEIIPVCPEQMGGLTTPREPAEIVNCKVIAKDGRDVTVQYKKGAETTLYLAKLLNADYAILKANSPSCGKGMIYDGSFTGKKIPGNGVTAQLLIDNGFKVITEEEL